MNASHLFPVLLSVALGGCVGSSPNNSGSSLDSVEQLGRLLYFDTDLSNNRTQSCASCHDPAKGFTDPRDSGVQGAVSLGDDGESLGSRNAPTASYAAHIPVFQRNAKGEYLGGQFLDGREPDLQGQAGGPPLNPKEMAMPDKASVVARLREKPVYLASFRKFYGAQIFDDTDVAYAAVAESIAAFEKTEEFSPFDSKYDRYLRGEYQMTAQEELGRTLFFSQQFTNCNLCHQLQSIPGQAGETFSNYKYENIGVPANPALAGQPADRGLLDNPAVNDPQQAGRFKVPTLRNVAVTGPYMHNGVFQDLRTVVLFYNKYNSRSKKRQINPETGQRWAEPEAPDNIALDKLQEGPALNDQRIDALVAFMKTLTDKRYEHLLKPQPKAVQAR